MPTYRLFFILSFVCSFMMACTSEQYDKAKSLYQQANSDQQIEHLLKPLTTLASLEPETYQQELVNVQSALQQLELAQRNMSQGKVVAAYLSSHNSYRKVSNRQAKALLVKNGKVLSKLVQVQALVLKSFQQRPDAISAALLKYQESSLDNWQLIPFNQLIKELIQSTKTLDTALTLLQNDPLLASSPELSHWRQQILFQSQTLSQVRNYFISHSLNKSALLLTELNDSLTEDAKGLLSYVRPKMAKAAMTPLFVKAQKRYAPYRDLIENLYLVVSKNTGEKDIDWYLKWSQLEQQVLQAPDSFAQYPLQYKSRVTGINQLLKQTQAKRPELNPATMSQEHFEQQNKLVNELLIKLKQDRAIINLS